MGAISEVRQLFQDLIAPDLKELKAEVKALAKRMDDRFDAINQRLTDAENLAAERHNQTLVEIRRTQDVNALWAVVRDIQDRLPRQ